MDIDVGSAVSLLLLANTLCREPNYATRVSRWFGRQCYPYFWWRRRYPGSSFTWRV